MTIIDVNLLIYAVNRDAVLHTKAKTWLEKALVDIEPLGFSWLVILAFLRLTTRPALFQKPLSPQRAFAAESFRSDGGMVEPARSQNCAAGIASLFDSARSALAARYRRQPHVRCTFGGSRHRTRRAALLLRQRLCAFPGPALEESSGEPLIRLMGTACGTRE